MKSTVKKVTSLLIIIMMILSISLPVVSRAVDVTSSEEDNFPLDVVLERDETNPNLIHITATDTESNITDLKYVHKYIDTDNVGYFEEEHDDIYTFNITPAQRIEESFELDGYGSYTVYAKNEKGYAFLARLTVNDPNDMPQITLTKDEENPLILNIDVTSNQNTITKLKIAKKEHINDNIDFSSQGTDIEFIESNHVSVRYTEITEEGLYVVYAEDSEGNKSTRQIYVAEKNTPISAEITNGTSTREVNLHITDAICNIISVKVAKLSEIGEDYDKFDMIEGLPITEGQTVNVSYTAPEDDTYIFCIEDEAGYRLITQRRITAEENTMNITIEQDENSPGNLTITATNSICNIVEMKVAIGDNIDLDYFENNGESISIEPGREVVGKYTVQENCTINVYVKDEQGYTYMYTKNLIGIDEPEPSQAPTITLTQNTENLKQIDVYVQADNSNVDEVKWAKGTQNIAYFETNGTRIGQDKVGVAIRTEFTIDATGTYTVYARDDNGNETVKTIEITNIDEVPPTEEDTTPPEVNDVEDNGIYNHSVTPNIVDEHLAEIYLTRDGIDVENYQNGDTIEDEGAYVLNAVDEAGNEVVVKFIIDKTAPEMSINQENTDNENVEVSMTFLDNLTSINMVKVAQGEQTIDYFENGGQELTLQKEDNSAIAAINVTQNGTYTVYVRDEAGNDKIQVFEVTTITEEPEVDDTTPPTIQTTKESINENESIKVTINVTDTESQIATIKIANGEQDIDYFENEGTILQMKTDDKSAEAAVMITENGTYTIYAEDEQGNKTVNVITITEIVTPDPGPDDTTPPTITAVEDGVTYEAEVTPRIEDENLASVTLTKDGNVVEDYQNGDTISENGTYVLTATDEAGNQTVVEFVVNIQLEEEDTTPPTITGVEDGVTYENEVTPRIEDENLASVTLTKNGNVVEDYQNGDTISENGTYVLTATDEAGNQTVVEFVIDIKEDDNDDDNNNTNTNNNNTSTDDNTTNTDNNDNNTTDNTNNNGSTNNNNINDDSDNHQQNTINNSGRNNSSTNNSKLPYAGLGNILIIGIIITSIVAIFTYIKYRKYKI